MIRNVYTRASGHPGPVHAEIHGTTFCGRPVGVYPAWRATNGPATCRPCRVVAKRWLAIQGIFDPLPRRVFR